MYKRNLLCVFLICIMLLSLEGLSSESQKRKNGSLIFDFEDGTLQGWEITEGAFDRLVSNRDFYHVFPKVRYNKQGKYYLSTVEQQPGMPSKDLMTGIVLSPVFILSSPDVSFLIGGGNMTNTYMAICTLDGQEHRKYTGRKTEEMRRVNDTVPELVGKPVFLKLVDHETCPWGHITFDDFHAVGNLAPELNDLKMVSGIFQTLSEMETDCNALEKVFRDNELEPLDLISLRHSLTAWREKLVALQKNENRNRQDVLRKMVNDFQVSQKQFADDLSLLRQNLLAYLPELLEYPVLYVVRKPYLSHYHAIDTLFNSDEYNCDRKCPHKNFFSPGASLKLWQAATNKSIVLIETPTGVVRDPDVSFDADRIVLSIRNDRDSDYHLWEVRLKGTGSFAGLLQHSDKSTLKTSDYPFVEGTKIRHHPDLILRPLTCAVGVADFDPIYLPDGSIVFASTREPKYNMCSRDLSSDLYRMNGDGSNICQLTKSTLFEHNPTLLPDGRICYHRWEYVDRNFGDAHALWTVTANGLNQSIYWGNNTAVPGGIYNPAFIPETGEMLCIFGPHHARENGALAIIDRRLGVDGLDSVKQIWPKSFRPFIRTNGEFDCDTTVNQVPLKFEDPYVLDESHFLVSRMVRPNEKMGLYLLDRMDNEILIREEQDEIHDACLVRKREHTAILEGNRDYGQKPGTCYVANVYEGTHMKSVPAGSVKYLRVVQSPEKKNFSSGAWNGQGYTAPGMNWHSLENKRILGTVPVEKDGSVAFHVPCDTFLYFQLLDEKGRMIQTMRSGTVLQSGETVSCIGCHEDRLQTFANRSVEQPLALKKKPQELKTWYGIPRNFGYIQEVQPVFDRLCVECHDYGKPAGQKLNLAGDRDLVFNTSYVNLWNSPFIKCIGGGPAALLDNRSWGSNASSLIAELDHPKVKEHIDAKITEKLTQEDLDRLCTWLDLNGVYNAYYESAWPDGYCGRAPYSQGEMKRLGELTHLNYYAIKKFHAYKQPEVCFERPQYSLCLKRLKKHLKEDHPAMTEEEMESTKEYKETLSLIRLGASRLAARPRADMPGFLPCEKDLERLRKYDFRRSEELRFRRAIQEGTWAYDIK